MDTQKNETVKLIDYNRSHFTIMLFIEFREIFIFNGIVMVMYLLVICERYMSHCHIYAVPTSLVRHHMDFRLEQRHLTV